jgi:hypothetical protein
VTDTPRNVRELLEAVHFRPLDVQHLLDPKAKSWVRFDSELGYLPADIVMHDGVDDSWTTYSHGPYGERRMIAHAHLPCRINTYGNSFTQCQQVSDGETWQERLAAHIGEPVRNFGVGGHSVYTQYLRALRMEATDAAAPYLLLNCFVDDHIRNLDAARWIRTAWSDRNRPGVVAFPLHGLPWSHLRYNLDTHRFEHQPGKCRSAADLVALTDKNRFVETFLDDQIARLFILQLGGEARCDDLEALAEEFGVPVNLRDAATRTADAQRLHLAYGIRSSMHILTQLRAWCRENHRELLVATSLCAGTLAKALAGRGRHDQEFIDFLEREGFRWFDALAMHRADFEQTNLTPEQYTARQYVRAKGAAVFGHYTPMANMLYAMGIKETVVSWLDPPPAAYKKPA